MSKLFTVVVGCYGDFPFYTIRCLDSICRFADSNEFDFFVGCNSLSLPSKEAVLSFAPMIDFLVLSKKNLNKDPMMRLMLDKVTTPYMLWLDDDSHFVEKGWDTDLKRFINAYPRHGLKAAGKLYFHDREKDYLDFLRKRPWFINEELIKEEKVLFPTGGAFLANTDFLRYHDFPDKEMIKKKDDLLLGELCLQNNEKIHSFTDRFLNKIKISDGERRGYGEESYCS